VYGIQMATFYVRRSYKRYGPISIPEPTSFLTNRQQYILYTRHQLTATVKYRAKWGIWVGSLCMRQCRYALAIGRGVFLPIDISRMLNDVHLLGDVHHVGCRITSPIDEV
jgi:hypothetical protein